jgi:hypothetical protein
MADTLGDLKALIADDLNRSDLTTQIATEIDAAIACYQGRRFYFNEENSVTFSTIASREWYDDTDNSHISNLIEIDAIRVLRNGSRYTLVERDFKTIEDKAVLMVATGQPHEFAYYDQKLRLYPIPNESLACNISGVLRLAALSGDSDSNAWTTAGEARDLVRYDAESRLYRMIVKDREAAADAEAMRDRELLRLESETNRRLGQGKVKPTSW